MRQNRKIRVLIADDHAIVRMGLSTLLGSDRELCVVGEAEDGREAVEKAVELRPDVVVMDLVMPGMDGGAATAAIVRRAPWAKVLILTTFGTSDGIAAALSAGAFGALLKSAANADLLKAIHSIAEGMRFVSPAVKALMRSDPPAPDMTPRQQEILRSLTRGRTNRDIAGQLGISPESVKDHVNAIFSKLGASNRSEAVAIAFRKHLLKL